MMTVNQLYQELEELQDRYSKALNHIAQLEKKVYKLARDNELLDEENLRLRHYTITLLRAIEIALQIKDYNAQTKHLKAVLEKLGQEIGGKVDG